MRSILRFKLTRTIWLILATGICTFFMATQIAYAQDAQDAEAPVAPAPPAAASTGGKSGTKGASKRTEINFEDQLIEGSASKPGIFFFMQQKGNNFKKLIKLRENFLPEMRRTSDEIVRKGSGT